MASLTKASRTRGVRTRNRRTAIVAVGITLFLIVDIVLVLWAVNANRPDPSAAPAPIPTFGTRSTPTPTPTPTVPDVIAAPRQLTVASGDVAWRAGGGTCPTPSATVEVTTDRGATWAPVTVPGAHRVLGLDGVDASQLRVISLADDSCAVTYSESFTAGQFFERYPDRLSGATYLDAVDPTTVHIGGAVSTAPCAVLQLAVSDQAAGAVCADELTQLPTGSTTWERATLTGLLSAAPRDGGGYTIARTGVEGCDGIAIESLVAPFAQNQPVAIGCVADAAPSEVTLASRAGAVWLWSGSTTRISTDGGVTWS